MINLTDSYVDGLALNSSASKNGRDLVKKNSFPMLCQSEDQTLLFGECKGSGSEPYRCSVDFITEGSPVFRCSCPSRQFPCKHLLGLLYAYTAGKAFVAAPIPPDILEKRSKAEKREEKKKEPIVADAPVKRKTNKSALIKKIAAQLEGIGLAEKLMLQLVQAGLGSVDKRMLKTMEDQIKETGNYYIPGIQYALRDILMQFYIEQEREAIYSNAMESLTILQAVLKKSRDYLQSRLDNPDAPMDTESTLEEWIGHAWQLVELREYGRMRQDIELLQLSFRSYSDQPRGEFVDEGVWLSLLTGQLHYTLTYRPFKAAKYIREEDSVFDIVQAKELFEYPGELNTRVRWEEASIRAVEPHDLVQASSYAQPSFPEVIKQVKNQIKNPLSDKHPVYLLTYAAIQQVKDTQSFVLVDEQGKQLPLADIVYLNQPTVSLLPMLNEANLQKQAMLVMFEHQMDENRLVAQPLSLVTANGIIRLLY